jgi:hypothetical protein
LANGIGSRLDAIAKMKFLEDISQMILDGILGDGQATGNVTVTRAFSHQT